MRFTTDDKHLIKRMWVKKLRRLVLNFDVRICYVTDSRMATATTEASRSALHLPVAWSRAALPIIRWPNLSPRVASLLKVSCRPGPLRIWSAILFMSAAQNWHRSFDHSFIQSFIHLYSFNVEVDITQLRTDREARKGDRIIYVCSS